MNTTNKLNQLLFDEAVVKAMNTEKVNTARLYNLLYSGKITLKEYLYALS